MKGFFYQDLSFEELEKLVAEMKAYAKSQPPFDPLKAMEHAKQNENVATEMVGGFMRVRGPEAIADCQEYNKCVIVGTHALQLSYYEMNVKQLNGRVGQLTLVDGYKLPLEKELVHGFVDMFFDYTGGRWRLIPDTPAHVAVVIEPLETRAV
jgi:hypothetical protein